MDKEAFEKAKAEGRLVPLTVELNLAGPSCRIHYRSLEVTDVISYFLFCEKDYDWLMAAVKMGMFSGLHNKYQGQGSPGEGSGYTPRGYLTGIPLYTYGPSPGDEGYAEGTSYLVLNACQQPSRAHRPAKNGSEQNG